jgi:hypothetical protein
LRQHFFPLLRQGIHFFKKKVARGGERTRVLSISFIFSFSPLYRWATATGREIIAFVAFSIIKIKIKASAVFSAHK